jgi:hypothetical protein
MPASHSRVDHRDSAMRTSGQSPGVLAIWQIVQVAELAGSLLRIRLYVFCELQGTLGWTAAELDRLRHSQTSRARLASMPVTTHLPATCVATSSFGRQRCKLGNR